jgi:hypothetical protein
MTDNLPDGFEMTEIGLLPEEGAVVCLLEAEEARAEADRALNEVLTQLGLPLTA